VFVSCGGLVGVQFLSQEILKFLMGWLVVQFLIKDKDLVCFFCSSSVVVLLVSKEIFGSL
jgi:hypothetical protein